LIDCASIINVDAITGESSNYTTIGIRNEMAGSGSTLGGGTLHITRRMCRLAPRAS
jgi:hypothetical protein